MSILSELFELFKPTVKDPVTLFFLVLLWIIFAWCLIVLLRKIAWKATRRINAAIKILKPYKKESIYDGYDTVKEEMLKIPNLGNYWREFDECLMPTEEDRRIHNSFNPREFFTDVHLIHSYSDQSSMGVIPPILTGLGILGTFVGLVLALHAFLTGVSPYTIDESALKTVLPSINQIADPQDVTDEQLDILLSEIEKSVHINLNQQNHDFNQEDLKKVIIDFNEEKSRNTDPQDDLAVLKKHLLVRLNTSTVLSTREYDKEADPEKLSRDINTEQLGRAIPLMIQSIQIAFKTSVWGIMLSIILTGFINITYSGAKNRYYKLLDILDELFVLHTDEDYLKEIRDISTQQLTQLKNLSDDLVEPMEQAMTKAVSATIEPVLNDLKTAIVKLSEFKQESSEKAIEKMVDTMMQKFAGATNEKMLSMGETMDKAASKMSEAVDRIEGLLGNMQETTSNQSQAIDHVVTSLSAVGETLAGFKTIGAEMNRQADVFSQMRSENLNMMERIKDVGDQTGTKIESLRNVSTTFEESVQKLQAISSQQADVGNIFNNVVISLSNLLGQLEKKLNLITEHGDKFSHNIKEMSSTLESMFILQDGYKESATVINSSLEGFKQISSTVEGSLDQLAEATDSLKSSTENYKSVISDFLNQGAEITQNMNDLSISVGKNWENHRRAFEELDKAISSGIDKYTQGVKDSLEGILGDFDGQMSNAVKLFADSIGELEGNLEKMNDILERFQKKHGGNE